MHGLPAYCEASRAHRQCKHPLSIPPSALGKGWRWQGWGVHTPSGREPETGPDAMKRSRGKCEGPLRTCFDRQDGDLKQKQSNKTKHFKFNITFRQQHWKAAILFLCAVFSTEAEEARTHLGHASVARMRILDYFNNKKQPQH